MFAMVRAADSVALGPGKRGETPGRGRRPLPAHRAACVAGGHRPVRHAVGEHRRRARSDVQSRDRRAGRRRVPAIAPHHALSAHDRGDAMDPRLDRSALPNLAADAAEDHVGVWFSGADVFDGGAQLSHARDGGGHPHPGDDAADGARLGGVHGRARHRLLPGVAVRARGRAGQFTTWTTTAGIARTAKGRSMGRSEGSGWKWGRGATTRRRKKKRRSRRRVAGRGEGCGPVLKQSSRSGAEVLDGRGRRCGTARGPTPLPSLGASRGGVVAGRGGRRLGEVDAVGVFLAEGGEGGGWGDLFLGAEGGDIFAGGAAGVAVGGEGVGVVAGGGGEIAV